MFGAYVKENRKALIALTVYTAVFALIFWLYRLPLGAVCLLYTSCAPPGMTRTCSRRI